MVRTCTGLVWVRSSFFSPASGGQKERVLHLAGGMTFREVQLGEIVIVALDVRPLGDGEAHVGEDDRQFVHHLRDRVNAAALQRARPGGERHVERLGLQTRLQRGFRELVAAGGDRLGRLVLQRVDLRALGLALLGRHFAQRREQRRNRALLTQRRDADGLQRGLVGGLGNLAQRIFFEFGDIGHFALSPCGEGKACQPRPAA